MTSNLASTLPDRLPWFLRSLELTMRWDYDAYIPDVVAKALICSETQLIVRALIALIADGKHQLARLVLVIRNIRSCPMTFAALRETIRHLLAAARCYGVKECHI